MRLRRSVVAGVALGPKRGAAGAGIGIERHVEPRLGENVRMRGRRPG